MLIGQWSTAGFNHFEDCESQDHKEAERNII